MTEKYLYLASKSAAKKDEKGRPVPVASHGRVYTIDETVCLVSGTDYDVVSRRVKRIAHLLNTYGE